ncbi:class II fructose-bisphosphate aldolase [Alkalibacter mobilis]|uniref:class II fructose-bisphosphate aldolase n=1 Tax=Alkalibacter mobilis TaxID=2787712 RepID=UPI00189D174A|nr:class II fructose-bisphosphate aldolase [Alkalibacter mobilis]MBF7097367.1 class II fructose-bisphosphate aldolase [Alkalibacter mobilis]
MTLVNTKKVLMEAKKGKYALGAFNVTTLDAIRGVIAAAEAENSPVIMEYAEVHGDIIDLNTIGPIMVKEAKEAKVPVVVHFDHGQNLDLIKRALEIGFTSVMIDGAELAYEENIALTKKVVEMAKEYDASVEAELGTMGSSESGEEVSGEAIYTDPAVAKDFVEKTGVDLLAVSFGTAHGLYIKKPVLDFERLEELSRVTPVPLVMHGGSGLSDEEYIESVSKGVCKINYYSDLANKVAKEVTKKLCQYQEEGKDAYIHDISKWSIDVVKEDVSSRIKVFGSAGKA